MPQPAENKQDADELIAAYVAAAAAIDQALGQLTGSPLAARSRQTHRGIRVRADVALDRLGGATAAWTSGQLPGVAARGAADAARALPDAAGVDAAAADVVEDLADELAEALTRAVATTRSSLATTLRGIATDGELGTATAGRDADAALQRLETLIAGGVHAVRYANGTRMPLAAYADMIIRTVVARAYNAGTLAVARQHGVGAVEVRDGIGCPWPGGGHGMPPTADGLVVSVALAEAHPIAHPNCTRSFLLLPDITDPAELDDGELDSAEPASPEPAPAAAQAVVQTTVRATLARYRARLEARARKLANRRTRRS